MVKILLMKINSTKNLKGITFAKMESRSEEYLRTMVIPLGEINDPQQKLCEDINLEWANEFQILGFNIDNKLERLHTNIESCTRKVRANINRCRKYNLAINRRMSVAKAPRSVIKVHLRSNSPRRLSKRDRIYPINT